MGPSVIFRRLRSCAETRLLRLATTMLLACGLVTSMPRRRSGPRHPHGHHRGARDEGRGGDVRERRGERLRRPVTDRPRTTYRSAGGVDPVRTGHPAAPDGAEGDAVAAREPQEMAQVAAETGAKKTHRTWDRVLVSAFLAGAYISFGGLVAITVSSGLDPATWGTLPTLFLGAAFTLGLVLVLIAGSDLATGNMMLVPLSAMRGKIGVNDVVRNLTLVLLGNLLGALFVAFFLAVQTDVIGDADSQGNALLTYERLASIAEGKTGHTAWETFLRGVGCNWVVCLAVWMSLAAQSVSGKLLAVFFPVMAFVAMGFDHVVANMFFLPAAVFAGVPGVGWGDTVVNWLLAGSGNLVGAVVFVATSYWYLFLRDRPDVPTPAAEPAE